MARSECHATVGFARTRLMVRSQDNLLKIAFVFFYFGSFVSVVPVRCHHHQHQHHHRLQAKTCAIKTIEIDDLTRQLIELIPIQCNHIVSVLTTCPIPSVIDDAPSHPCSLAASLC